ncbi:MAG: rod shape-determining protein MreD [Gemmatimonadota bacterium]
MSAARASRGHLFVVLAFLVVLHFYVRPRLWDARVSPDFLMIALMLYAMRSRPGDAAIAGLVTGLAADSLAPAHFGAGMLAHTAVAYVAAWGRAVFFADNLLVTAGMIATGVWLRNVIVLLTSGTTQGQLLSALLVYGPLQALTTAVFGVLLFAAFREWFAISLDM